MNSSSNFKITNPKISSDKLELILKTNFMEALKDSNLGSFSFSESVRVHLIKDLENPHAILLFREIEPDKLAEIDFVATSVDFKRQGLASQLIQDLSGKYNEIWLELGINNHKALSMYRKLGFLPQGERPNYYGKGQHATNMVKTRAT